MSDAKKQNSRKEQKTVKILILVIIIIVAAALIFIGGRAKNSQFTPPSVGAGGPAIDNPTPGLRGIENLPSDTTPVGFPKNFPGSN